jgi:nitroreductase
MTKTIQNHRSIRQFLNKDVEKKVLDQILEAAIRASNTGNMQTYSIIVTKDESKKELLWASHFKQNMVLQAPVVLTFCADINRFSKWCKINGAEPGYDNFLWLYNATIDAVLASQNATLEAEANGLGVCYLGTTTYMADNIIDILNLPQGVIPVTSIVVGYASETPELTDRLPLEAVVHYEEYTEYNEQNIKELYAEKEALPAMKKFVEENNKASLAHVFTDVRYKKGDNIFFSNKFLEIIKKQGFFNQ